MRAITAFFLVVSVLPAHGLGQACGQGQRRLSPSEPCIPETLFNYLYCLEKSGSGKVEFVQRNNDVSEKGREFTLDGKATGVILSGALNGGYKQNDVSRVAREISQKVDPTLAGKCEAFAKLIDQSGVDTIRWNGKVFRVGDMVRIKASNQKGAYAPEVTGHTRDVSIVEGKLGYIVRAVVRASNPVLSFLNPNEPSQAVEVRWITQAWTEVDTADVVRLPEFKGRIHLDFLDVVSR